MPRTPRLHTATEKTVYSELIKKYKDNSCLWDKKCRAYTAYEKRTEAYESLLETFRKIYPNANINLLKNKLDSLRTVFIRELKRVRQSEAKGEERKPTLWYFDQFLFLEEVYSEKNWSSTKKDKKDERPQNAEVGKQARKRKALRSDDIDIQEINCDAMYDCSYQILDQDSNDVSEVESAKVPTISSSRRSVSTRRPETVRKSARLSSSDVEKGASRFGKATARVVSEVAEVCDKSDDQFDKYAKYIASQLRELPIRRFVYLQGQINNLITNERLTCLDEESDRQMQSLSSSSLMETSCHKGSILAECMLGE